MGAVELVAPEVKEEFKYTSYELLKEFMMVQLKTPESGINLGEQWTKEQLEKYQTIEF